MKKLGQTTHYYMVMSLAVLLATGWIEPTQLGDNSATKKAALAALDSVDTSTGSKYVHNSRTSMSESSVCSVCNIRMTFMFYAQEMKNKCTKVLCSACAGSERQAGRVPLLPCCMAPQETVAILRTYIECYLSHEPAPVSYDAATELSTVDSAFVAYAPADGREPGASIGRALIAFDLGRMNRAPHCTDAASYKKAQKDVDAALGEETAHEREATVAERALVAAMEAEIAAENEKRAAVKSARATGAASQAAAGRSGASAAAARAADDKAAAGGSAASGASSSTAGAAKGRAAKPTPPNEVRTWVRINGGMDFVSE